jgi:hypothetical protein
MAKTNYLPPDLLAQLKSEEDMVPGRPYLITCTFGWAFIGYYVDRPDPLCFRFAFCRHFAAAGKHYGLIATQGLGDKPSAIKEHGRWKMIERMQIISVESYEGEAFYAR